MIAVASAALGIANGGYSQEAVAIATVVIWVPVAVGIVVGLWSRSEISRSALVSGLALLGLFVLSATSMAWADDPGRSFDAAIRVAGYLGLFTLVVLAAPRTGKRAWVLGLAAGITIVCILALASRFVPSLLGEADRQLGELIPTAAGRLSYPIGYWNGLGALLAIDIVLLAWLGSCARGRVGRAFAVALLPLPMLGIYLASSRGGVVAAAAGGALLLILARNRVALLVGGLLGGAGGALLVLVGRTQADFAAGVAGASATHQGEVMLLLAVVCVGALAAGRYLLDPWLGEVRSARRRPLWPWVAVLAIAIGAVIALVSRENTEATGGGGSQGVTSGGHLTSARDSGRYQFWVGALDAFASHPVGGVGAGNFELYWNAHPQRPVPLVNAHSLYLETLAELGPAGLALVLVFLAAPGVALARRLALPESATEVHVALAVLAAGALSAALEWTWQIPAAFAPVIVAVGLLAAANGAAQPSDRHRRTGQRRFALAIATLIVAWAAAWAAAVSFATDRELAASRSAAARGDLTAAADDARDAGSLQPWSPEPLLQLALVAELGRDFESAKQYAFDAIQHAPGDWRLWAVAGRIEAKSGNLGAAGWFFTRARQLSPIALPAAYSLEPGT
jgi:hypothetical protein